MGQVKTKLAWDDLERAAALAEFAPSFHYDSWVGQYHDRYNDIWVRKPTGREQWVVAFRDRGNVTCVVSRHRDLTRALAAAEQLYAERKAFSA